MINPRYLKLAKLLVGHSCNVQKGENVIIHINDDVSSEMISMLVREVYSVGGNPIVWNRNLSVFRTLLIHGTKDSIKALADSELETMKKAAAYIAIRGSNNDVELSDVPSDKMDLYEEYWWKPVHLRERVPNTNWVVLIWPTSSTAQRFGMSTEAFEDFYFDVCADVNYEQMSVDMDPLVDLINRTNKVLIIGPGKTNLKFSIKGMGAKKCMGRRNVPDGEVFTAPEIFSVNGVIEYNTPTIYSGKTFANICLAFKDGKITEAACGSGDVNALNRILDTDDQSRYIGEFAFGLNPKIKKPVMNILFDEKIAGSIHFTPGDSYENTPADNGNRSKVHWDLVLMQTKEYGGGEIYFDDQLIRKDGIFVLPELINLNS